MKASSVPTTKVKRQALFSCLTAGLMEMLVFALPVLYLTMMAMRLWNFGPKGISDVTGNSKFGEFFCKLMTNKDVDNTENKYNHNFKGMYCMCDQPYPDPDVEEQVETIQCCMCEDWFHEEHIGLQRNDKIPRDEEGEPLYEDFICQMCAGVCSFLTCYPQIILASQPSDTTKQLTVQANTQPISIVKAEIGNSLLQSAVISMNDSETVSKESNAEGNSSSQSAVSKNYSETVSKESNVEGNSSSQSTVSNIAWATVSQKSSAEGIVKKESTEVGSLNASCIIEDLIGNLLAAGTGSKPLFILKNWREIICRCEKCSNMYVQRGLPFLLDKEDSIAEYEQMAKQKRNENMQKQEGAEMSFLNNLGHVEKIEILNGIADMKNELFSFMESSDPLKAITTADVQQVFDNLAKKRKRMG